MFNIFSFELSYRFRRPATYIFFAIMFALAFIFATTDAITIGGASGSVNKNAPYTINQIIAVLTLIGTLIISAVMGVPVYRDFEHNFHEIMFTTPVKKLNYLAGRFLGSYIVCLFIFSGIILGVMIGVYMPWVDGEKVGPFNLMYYLHPFITMLVPNVFILGAVFFTLGSLLRSQFAIFVQGVVFFLGYILLIDTSSDVESNPLFSLFDPYGLISTFYQTRYWTPSEKNSMVVPLTSYLLYNRLIWIGAGTLIGLLCIKFFKFSKSGLQLRKKLKAEKKEEPVIQSLKLPHVANDYSFASKFKMWRQTLRFEFFSSIRSIPFLAITFCGVLFLLAQTDEMGKLYGTAALHVTYMITDELTGNFTLFLLIIITLYSGEMIWKDRQFNFSNITDALPVSKKITMTARFAAMCLIVAMLLIVLMLTGMLMQTINGYTRYDVPVYLKQFFMVEYPFYVLTILLAFFIHNIVNNKFIGHTLVVIYFIGFAALAAMGIDHNMIWYGDTGYSLYSDMNKFGHFLYAKYLYVFYWLGLGIAFFMVGMMLTRHGSEVDFKTRIHQFKNAWRNGQGKLMIPIGLAMFVLFGSFIFYNTNILNEYQTKTERAIFAADFEKKFRKYIDYVQPRITDVNISVDIFPEKREASLKGYYIIKNKSKQAIDSLFVTFSDSDVEIKKLDFGIPAKQLTNYEGNFYIYSLSRPLQPGDSSKVTFDLYYPTKGFKQGRDYIGVFQNGTFINNNTLPSFGYSESVELTENDDRKKYGLPKRQYSMRLLSDSVGVRNNYLSQDADWINYECVISTSADQIAISPGYLQKEWKENGRNYFHYKMDAPIVNFYSFLSARYAVFRDKYKGINIEIFYHPTHNWNIEKMNKSIKHTIDYCQKNFSPYQFKQVRILEFPRYQQFAQSFPNTIPFSEAIGFIMKVDDDNDVDMAYYVTSHEVAHQWWGHQVAGANTLGSTIMVESMAQYTALMVMEKEYTAKNINKYLKYELDRYLAGRSFERKGEQPMVTCDNQQYIHYQKGSLVMYQLKDLIGEDSLNAALSRFIKEYGFQSAPYVQSPTFVNYLRNATPDSLKYVVTDLFEKITLFNLQTTEATAIKQGNNYRVKIKTEAEKVYSDSIGNEQKIPIRDWIDIGVFTEGANGKDSLIYVKRNHFNKKESEFEITVSAKPTKAGIDPMFKLIDRATEDNLKKIEVEN